MYESNLKRMAEDRRSGIAEAWDYLERKGYVGEALDRESDEAAVEYIIREFDDLPEKGWGGPGSRRETRSQTEDGETVQATLREVELEHQAALEHYLAMCAACDLDVYRFREKVLGGRLLADSQAQELLRSPVAAVLESRLFEAWKLPVIGHSAKVEWQTDLVPPGVEEHTVTITFSPSGITHELKMPTWPGSTRGEKQRIVVLKHPDEQGKILGSNVWSISLLGDLRNVGEKLSDRYRWKPAQAVWFVLTGEIPAVPALMVTRTFPSSMYHHDTLITIEASPWVSSKTVERAYRQAQIKTLGSSGGRPLGKRGLKLLRFVIERLESLRIEDLGKLEGGQMPSGAPEGLWGLELVARYPLYRKMPKGKRLVSEWNETSPKKWGYGDNTRWFWKDYHRAKNAVAYGPPYK